MSNPGTILIKIKKLLKVFETLKSLYAGLRISVNGKVSLKICLKVSRTHNVSI